MGRRQEALDEAVRPIGRNVVGVRGASDDPCFVNGVELSADGGFSAI